ncbi:uncharacterized protein LOC119349227 [Triticum dicoccoides]|uniref:uncharacterized protein LOC119349227 n=1 Tax=Triticum dicoccoides TaxID=85692 RepID=UPI00188EF9D6|nr:uncharacterized protein LOC119349227 [Triticum dicoccoides]
MASAIRSAGALRRRLPLLLRSSTGFPARALEEERRCLARPLTGNPPRLFSSDSGGRGSSYKHPCKFNLGCKKHMEGQLAYLRMAAEKDARDWREMREILEASAQRQAEHDEECKRQDKVVNCAAAVLFLALFAGHMFFR